jgi:OHCU decarboxylase
MKPSRMTKAQFVDRFGGVYEASAWVAEAVWPQAQAGGLDDPDVLAREMRTVVDGAPLDAKLALVRAHPELASGAAIAEASAREQAGAGLDQASPAEAEAFTRLNGAYAARFGFPFILAVKGLSRREILAAFETRLANDPETEFEAALNEIHRIAGYRLAELV